MNMPYSYVGHMNDFYECINPLEKPGPSWWVILHVESEFLDDLWAEINLAIEKCTEEITQKYSVSVEPIVRFSDWKIKEDLPDGNIQPILRDQQTGMWSAYIDLDWNITRGRKIHDKWPCVKDPDFS